MARRSSRKNPYAQPYPADWHEWTRRQQASWRRRNWVERAGDRPRSLEQRAASRLARGNPQGRLLAPARLPHGLAGALRRGALVEREHTKDAKTARIIASHHLAEDPRYYTKLAKMERRNPGKRGRYFVRDEWLGEMVELPSVRSAARFARSRLGDLGDIYVEEREQLVPLRSLRRSSTNPRRRRVKKRRYR